MTQLYPSYNGITRKIENIPVDQLSREYIEQQIRYHKNRIKESEYLLSILQSYDNI